MTNDTVQEANARARFEQSQQTEPEKARTLLANYFQCKEDPWYFLKHAVFTQDQVDRETPIKAFPADLEYLELFTRYWQKYNFLAVPKSRRMTLSWTAIALYTWDTLFHSGRFNGFVSKKEDDAADLVARAQFIYEHIPKHVIPEALLPKIRGKRMSKQPPVLDFEDINSKIQGFPMGSDQLRQFTLSGVLGDEAAFWPEAEHFYSSTKPTLDGGGRMTLISSRSPGFFKKIVFDQLDAIDLNFPEIPPAQVKRPMPGIEIWHNPRNKFCTMDIHYTAHPEKRSHEWRESVRLSMPSRQFSMEYEKSWSTYEGLAVYADFSKLSHVSAYGLTPQVGAPLLLGWDWGLTPACIVAQLIEGRLLIYKEFIGTNIGAVKFATQVWQNLRLTLTQWTHSRDSIISFIDPAGLAKSQVDERTCAQALRDAGFTRIEPGPIDFETRKQAVEYFLTRQTKDGPAFVLDPRETPVLTEGFTGGYRFSEKELDRESAKLRPIKDRYSHPHDALQYLAAGAVTKLSTFKITIPRPDYSFLKRTKETA